MNSKELFDELMEKLEEIVGKSTTEKDFVVEEVAEEIERRIDEN